MTLAIGYLSRPMEDDGRDFKGFTGALSTTT
jgi:hypothetical protein